MRLFNILKNLARSTPRYNGTLTRTYSSNSYVNETAFNRMYFYQYGDFCIGYINLQITTSLPSNSTWVQIGTLSLPTTIDPAVMLVLPCQSGNGHLLFTIEQDGRIRILNGSGTAISGFCRTVVMFHLIDA